MAGGRAPVALGQAAPGDEAHDAIGVAAQNRGPAAMHRVHDGVQRRFVDILDRLGAIEPIGETVERRLFVSAARHDGFRALARSDVTGNLRGADDPAMIIPHRRNCERDIDQPAVLATAHRLVMLDALAAADTSEDARLFRLQIIRNDRGDRLADHLFGGIAELAFGARIPTDDDGVEVLADDCVIRRFDDAGELPARLFSASLIGNVEERSNPSFDLAVGIEFGSIGDGKTARAAAREIEFTFEIHRFALENLGDMRLESAETTLADHLFDRLADHRVALVPGEIGISLADEAITQVAAAAHQHERRAIDDRLQFGLAGAQRLLGAFAFSQFLKAANSAISLPLGVLQWRDIHQHRDSRTVRPLDKQFGTPDRHPASQRYANWAGRKRNRNAFERVAAEINLRKFVRVADPRGTAPKLDRAPVIACKRAIAAANAQPSRNRIQRALINID